jgi:hypothetical protein
MPFDAAEAEVENFPDDYDRDGSTVACSKFVPCYLLIAAISSVEFAHIRWTCNTYRLA